MQSESVITWRERTQKGDTQRKKRGKYEELKSESVNKLKHKQMKRK